MFVDFTTSRQRRSSGSYPSLGRFVEGDPIGYEGGPNLYAYVGNDPINWVDPLGLCPFGQIRVSAGGGSVSGNNKEVVISNNTICMPLDSIFRTPVLNPGPGGGGGGGGGAKQRPAPAVKRAAPALPKCNNVNLVGSVDAGIFLGYGWGFTLGVNVNGDTGAITAFATARVGTGLGWIAGAGVGISNSAPQPGISRSTNTAIGIGSEGGSVSTSDGGTSVSGGASAGPKFGVERSRTENLTESYDLRRASEQCR